MGAIVSTSKVSVVNHNTINTQSNDHVYSNQKDSSSTVQGSQNKSVPRASSAQSMSQQSDVNSVSQISKIYFTGEHASEMDSERESEFNTYSQPSRRKGSRRMTLFQRVTKVFQSSDSRKRKNTRQKQPVEVAESTESIFSADNISIKHSAMRSGTSTSEHRPGSHTRNATSSQSRKQTRQRSKTLPIRHIFSGNKSGKHSSMKNIGFTASHNMKETSNYNQLSLENATRYVHLKSSGRDEDGNMMINDYTLLHTIGSGGYGKVKLATNSSNRAFAIKIINKSLLSRIKQQGGGSALESVQREIAILKKLRHPNIVRLFEVIDDQENGKLFLVMEAIENGPIVTMNDDGSTSHIIDEIQARRYMFDIVHGLEYLHSQGIVHHDIKPENLLVDSNDNVKLTDFGVSHEVGLEDSNSSRAHYTGGTPAFSPPEISDNSVSFDGKVADIWSLGVTLWVIIFGHIPFEGDTVAEILKNIASKDVVIPDYPIISLPLRDLIQQMMCKDPKQRISIENIKKHPWMIGEYSIKQVPDASMINNTARNITSSDVQNAIKEGSLKGAEKMVMLISIKQRLGRKANEIRARNAEKRASQERSGSAMSQNSQSNISIPGVEQNVNTDSGSPINSIQESLKVTGLGDNLLNSSPSFSKSKERNNTTAHTIGENAKEGKEPNVTDISFKTTIN